MPINQDSQEYIHLLPYQELIAGIKASLSVHEGVIKLTAPDGMGKSALCHQLQSYLIAENKKVLYFETAVTSPDEIETRISELLELDNKTTFTRALTQKLSENPEKPTRLILIFDDAELISDQSFQAIRMLANIQNQQRGLVQIVVAGTPALNKKLNTPQNRALMQSVSQTFVIEGLKYEEVEELSRVLMRKFDLEKMALNPSGLHYLHKVSKGKPGSILIFWRKLAEHKENLPSSLNKSLVQKFLQPEIPSKVRSFPMLATTVFIVALVAGAGYWLGTNSIRTHSTATNSTDSLLATAEFEVNSVETADLETGNIELEMPPVEMDDEMLEQEILNSISAQVEEFLEIEESTEENAEENIADFVLASEEVFEEMSEESSVPASPVIDSIVASDELSSTTVLPTSDEESEEGKIEKVEQFVKNWLNSWQEKNVEEYLAFYDRYFFPSYHASKALWQDDRTVKVSRAANISLAFSELKILSEKETEITIQFLQDYSNPTYADQTLKELTINTANATWTILGERNIDVTRLR